MQTNLKERIKQRFQEDIKDHKMTIQQDDHLHRHLLFKRPGTGDYWFEIITWPGTLCISGDMQTFVFSRLPDMFEFFIDPRYEKVTMDVGYWSSKLLAGEFEEYSSELAEKLLWQHFDSWAQYTEKSKKFIKNERTNVQDYIAEYVHDKLDFCQAIQNYSQTEDGVSFDDFLGHSFNEYKTHYLWCCNAIVWGIQQYRATKASAAQEGASV